MDKYLVNIGDGDVLHIEANSLAELEKKIKKANEFEPWMINAVVKEGREYYLKTWLWNKVCPSR